MLPPELQLRILAELDTIENKLIPSLYLSVPYDKKQSRNLRASKENRCNTGGFVMHVSDHELGFSDSDIEEEVVNSSMVSGGRFSVEELCISDGSDYELSVDAQCQLMDKVGLAEGALHELSRDFQLNVSEEVRNKISTLETSLVMKMRSLLLKLISIEGHNKRGSENLICSSNVQAMTFYTAYIKSSFFVMPSNVEVGLRLFSTAYFMYAMKIFFL